MLTNKFTINHSFSDLGKFDTRQWMLYFYSTIKFPVAGSRIFPLHQIPVCSLAGLVSLPACDRIAPKWDPCITPMACSHELSHSTVSQSQLLGSVKKHSMAINLKIKNVMCFYSSVPWVSELLMSINVHFQKCSFIDKCNHHLLNYHTQIFYVLRPSKELVDIILYCILWNSKHEVIYGFLASQ